MILRHNKELCEIQETEIFDDQVLKQTIKNLSPFHIYVENKEFLDSFATTLVNYSPVSINITDYWNKDIVDNTAFIPYEADPHLKIIHPFEFEESVPEKDPNYGAGFFAPSSDPNDDPNIGFGGAFTDLTETFDKNLSPSLCGQEKDERFFVNSIIGLQDNLAKVHMNNFYSTLEGMIRNPVIFNRIRKIVQELELDTNLFANTNEVFTEDKFLGNRNFVTKKGTDVAIKYAGRTANDAQIQGTDQLSHDYYMNVKTEGPFRYSVESNLLDVVFEKFVKPLAHPIGMGYEYRTVCTDETADRTETPLIKLDYSDVTLSVNCLCYSSHEDELLPPDVVNPPQETFDCIYNTNPNDYPDPKIFASPSGTGLWEALDPVLDFNILDTVEEGYEDKDPDYTGWVYRKYTMTNGNYLITYKNIPDVNDTSVRIDILYYRKNETNPIHKFVNQRHCNTQLDKEPTRVSIVDETFSGDCTDIYYGIFQFLDNGETTPPETPAPSGFHEGFWVDLDDDGNPDEPPLGGVMIRYDELYFGWFHFLAKNEPIRPDRFSPSGFYEGYDMSYLDRIIGPIIK